MYSYGDTIVVKRGEIVKGDILPRSQEDFLKTVILEPGAFVKGSIVAEKIELASGSRVSGGLLASEIVFNVSEVEEGKAKKIVVQGDVMSTSMVSTDVDTRVQHDVIIHIVGNLIASDRVKISNAIVEGNILTSMVDMHGVVASGILGLIRFGAKEPMTKQENTLSNSIFLSIISEKGFEILKHGNQQPVIGVYSPFVYISPTNTRETQGHDSSTRQRIAVIRVRCVLELFNELEEILGRPVGGGYVGDLVSSKLSSDECVLYELTLDHARALAPLALLETLPAIRIKRKNEDLRRLLPLEKITAGIGELYLREEEGENETRRLVLREISRARRELLSNPLRARDIEQLFINNEKHLTDEDKNNIRRLLSRYPPRIEFEAEIKSPDPLQLPSKLVCELRSRNTGVRSCQISKIIAKITSKANIEDSFTLEIDPPSGVDLELAPGESKTISVKIDVNKIGEFNVRLGIKYVDKTLTEYVTDLRDVGSITVIMPPISEIQSRRLDDEFNKSRIEMVLAINEALNKIANLYRDAVERPKKEIIVSFNAEFPEYVRSILKGDLLRKLQTVRNQYQIHLSACTNLNKQYSKIVEEIENEITHLEKEIMRVREVLIMEDKSIIMKKEIHGRLCNIIKGVFKLKWIEDEEFREQVERLKEQIRSQVLSEGDINFLNTVFLMIIITRGEFEVGFVKDIKERLYHHERRSTDIRELAIYLADVSKLLEELKVDTTC